MATNVNVKMIRFVKTLIDLLYGALVFASIALALLLLISPILLSNSDLLLTASVPVAIGKGHEPQFDVEIAGSAAKGIQAAFVDEAKGTLRLETSNPIFVIVSYAAKLLTAIGLAYVFHLLRTVLRDILRGDIFTPQNSERVRRIGYFVLLVGLLRPTVEYLAANEIFNQLPLIEPALSLPSPFKVEVILTSLLIVILAQVWSYGLQLERDQALTI